MGNAPRLRFDDCHHEVHISGGAAETPSQLQSYQRSAGIMTRAKNSCLEKLEDARLARRRYSRRAAAGRQGASRLRTPTTLCCSTTPWSSANKVSGAEGGGWALKIHFAMEFKVQSEPRPDERPAPSQMQGMSSVACNAAP